VVLVLASVVFVFEYIDGGVRVRVPACSAQLWLLGGVVMLSGE
jgi:hypothetical protein